MPEKSQKSKDLTKFMQFAGKQENRSMILKIIEPEWVSAGIFLQETGLIANRTSEDRIRRIPMPRRRTPPHVG